MSTTLDPKTLKKAMRENLIQEVDKQFDGQRQPTAAERQEAYEAIDELVESMDVENMSTEDLESIAADLGLKRSGPSIRVHDRRGTTP